MPVMEFKRTKRPADNVLVAATAVDVTDQGQLAKLRMATMVSKTRTNRAWEWYDKIGEIRFGINKSARQAGTAVLVPVQRVGTTLGKPVIGNTSVNEVIAGIWSPNGGLRHLIQSFYKLMRMHGQGHLIRLRNDDGSHGGYEFISDEELIVEELTKRGEFALFRSTLPTSGANGMISEELKRSTWVEIKPEDYLGRVWYPHPKHSDMPDSPMYALDDVCEELYLLTLNVKAKLRSRLALAGILYVPSEVSEVMQTKGTEDDQTRYSNDAVIDAIIKTLMHNVQHHGDASSQFPIIVRGPGEHAQNLVHITIPSDIYEVDIKLREEALGRVLHGLDIMPETVTGTGNSNHWGAWSQRDDDLKTNVIPDLEMLAWTLEQLVLVPELERMGEPTDAIGLWFDTTSATSRPNLAEDARQGQQAGVVSGAGYMALAGIDPEHAMPPDEYVRWLGAKIGDPYLATFGLPIAEKIDWEKVTVKSSQPTGPDPQSAPPSPVSPARPGSDGQIGKTDSNKSKSQRPAA